MLLHSSSPASPCAPPRPRHLAGGRTVAPRDVRHGCRLLRGGDGGGEPAAGAPGRSLCHLPPHARRARQVLPGGRGGVRGCQPASQPAATLRPPQLTAYLMRLALTASTRLTSSIPAGSCAVWLPPRLPPAVRPQLRPLPHHPWAPWQAGGRAELLTAAARGVLGRKVSILYLVRGSASLLCEVACRSTRSTALLSVCAGAID